MRASSRYERDGLSIPSTDGVTVVVHDLSGESDSRAPVLLVHATGFHGYVWQPFADHLRHHHAFAPDLRGHGDATAPDDGDFGWNGFADDVLAIVDTLGLDDLDAVGHSKGGAALLLAEARQPGTFRSLYLYEPVLMPAQWASDNVGSNPLADGARRRRPVFDVTRRRLRELRGQTTALGARSRGLTGLRRSRIRGPARRHGAPEV